MELTGVELGITSVILHICVITWHIYVITWHIFRSKLFHKLNMLCNKVL